MSFLASGQRLVIDSAAYRVAEHPAVPGYPYGQEGRQGIVYQLIPEEPEAGQRRALKLFKPWHRRPSLVSLSRKMQAFAHLSGLSVCGRTVLTPQQHPELLREQSDLLYAVLMPWIEGPTWMEVMLDQRPLLPEQSLGLARSLASVLTDMEQHGLAHCDLSGANLLLPGLAGAGAPDSVALVDVEQLYGPGLERPEALPMGSSGYGHKAAGGGLWEATADRFAGAILLAEILGWCDERVRQSAWGETYFDVHEMPTGVPGLGRGDTERYQTLLTVLADRYGQAVAGLLERAWRSDALGDCATFGEWLLHLPRSAARPHDPLRTAVRAAMEAEDAGHLPEALALYEEALALAEPGSPLATELEATVQELKAAPDSSRPLPALLPTTGTGVQMPIDPQNAHRVVPLSPPEGRFLQVTHVVFSSDGALLAAAAGSGTVQLWQTNDGSAFRTLQVTRNGLSCIALSPVGALLAAALTDGTISLWDLRGGQQVDGLAGAQGLTCLAFSPDGVLLAAGARDGSVWLWNLTHGEVADRFQGRGGITALAFAPDGSALCAASAQKTVLWLPDGTVLPLGGGATALAMTADGLAVIAGTSDGGLRRLAVSKGAPELRLTGHTGAITSLAAIWAEGLLVSGSADGTVRLWRVEDGASLKVLRGHAYRVTGVAVSPDGARLASCSYEGVRLWAVR